MEVKMDRLELLSEIMQIIADCCDMSLTEEDAMLIEQEIDNLLDIYEGV